jgi:hypothetical protein
MRTVALLRFLADSGLRARVTAATNTPTRYVEVWRRFLREHPVHTLDSWPLPADDFLQERELTTR